MAVLPLWTDSSRFVALDGGSVDRFSNGRPGSNPTGRFAIVESVEKGSPSGAPRVTGSARSPPRPARSGLHTESARLPCR